MNAHLPGAIIRAASVGFLIVTPSLLLGPHAVGPSEMAVLLSIIAAMATFLEYRSSYPSFVEFRDAPPINRIRFLSLFVMVFLMSLLCQHVYQPSSLTTLVSGIGTLVGSALDFPFSPVRLVLLMLPQDISPVVVHVARAGAGLSYVIGALSVAGFFCAMRLWNWPVGHGAFNVWVNLPLFDPTAGRDVVARLSRDGRFNIILGILLPFLIPAVIRMSELAVAPMNLDNPHVLIWTLAGWSFVPASMVIRGLALLRVSELIQEKRRRAYATARMQTA